MMSKKKKSVYITENKRILLEKMEASLKEKKEVDKDDRGNTNRDSKA